MSTSSPEAEAVQLLQAARGGDRSALARLLTMVERGGEEARQVAQVTSSAGVEDGYTVGITGAPGAGKSTLTNSLVSCMRAGGEEVAVLAVDPSSPFSGGAILGDRVRMSEHALDPGVFIRSMATRGHLGGLGLATPSAVRLLHAAGRPWVLIETVGVGQVEVEVAGSADTTVVVVNPGWGDMVQANKAGLLEIADIFVVNKADRAGAGETRRDLEAMLALGEEREWVPPVVCTVALSGEGVGELWHAIRSHRSHLVSSGAIARRRAARVREELERIVTERLRSRAEAALRQGSFEELHEQLVLGEVDPWTAADLVLAALGEEPAGDGSAGGAGAAP